MLTDIPDTIISGRILSMTPLTRRTSPKIPNDDDGDDDDDDDDDDSNNSIYLIVVMILAPLP